MLYVIGVGPGDPELLTLKAARILREAQCICVPKGREEGSSLALSIVQKALSLDGKELIEAHFPMRKTKAPEAGNEPAAKWNETAERVLNTLNKGTDVAFITIGDPTIYSTFFYLYDRLIEALPALRIDIVPGISSINASSARAGISLGLADEKIAILPATYSADALKETIAGFDTIVLMKVHKVFDKVLSVLDELGLTDHSVYVSRAGMSDELIVRDISTLKGENLNYFSTVVIKK
jgi:precorrin-2/cobalt-factor-2 C20-methyltransferase